jgi:hypothetical protein
MMDPSKPQPPVLASGAPSAGSALRRTTTQSESPSEVSPGANPEAVAEQILALLDKGLYLPARNLAKEAAARFPEHARLQKLWYFFDNRGKARPSALPPQPGTDEEFEWLRHPPAWAHGKWVALIGSKAVAVGDTLKEVAEAVRHQSLSRQPLVHHID